MNAKGARRKGMKAEGELRDWFRNNGFPQCERIPAGMESDRGDLSGIDRVTVQVKNYADTGRAVREGLHGALAQQAQADTDYAAAIIKPPGVTDPGKWRVVMTVEQWAQLVKNHGPDVNGAPAFTRR